MNNKTAIPAVLILAILLTALLTGCADSSLQTRQEEVSGFNRIRIETFGEFIIQQGSEESLSIEAPRDYLRYVTTEVENNELIISTRRGFIGAPIERVTFTLTVKDLNKVSLSGAGAIKILKLDTDDLEVDLTGAGSVEIDHLSADNLDINLTSAGAIVVAGEVDNQQVNISGVGSYEAGDLRSNNAEILLTGAGSAIVWAEGSLDVNVTGVGSISYFGENPQVSQNVSGLGSVNSKGAHD
ncbi:MAG: DUF2807 domain-containing protein [Anaerolineae bacterium]|nr:DUF2807 domain-containing protein [Anaerolineae bacterium]